MLRGLRGVAPQPGNRGSDLPYVKEIEKVLFVNDGSAGNPKDRDPRAAYGLLEIGASAGPYRARGLRCGHGGCRGTH